MSARLVLTILAVVFLAAGVTRLIRDHGRMHGQSKTWLIVAAIFGVVSAWLWLL
jgi:uncharacterized membrane protein HdeD (DUF308 family)